MHTPRPFAWVFIGAVLLAAGYLPTLRTPFDFIDDGNLVYPYPSASLGGHVAAWWERVEANYEHLGPFRPTLWVHWYLTANAFDGDAFAWRLYRLVWCGVAAGMLLWLFRELNLNPVAGLMAGALAMWNPYRNEIWTSLTLAEGVAMPYALFGLIAARKATASTCPFLWELGAVFGVVVALGCKNTFAAIIPAQIALRLLPDGVGLRAAWRANRWRALALGLPVVLPIAHFVYFKLHWHPGQYETQGPTVAQFGRILSSLKGAMSLDFLGLGIVLGLVAVCVGRRVPCNTDLEARSPCEPDYRAALICGVLLTTGGMAAYLPMGMMSGRYAMPAVWGLDIGLAVLLTALASLPRTRLRQAAWGAVGVGVALVMVANVGRQEKFAARANLLWEAVHYVEATTPNNARVGWLSGDSLKGSLNVEEGIHFQWHLSHRGRPDIRIGLFEEEGSPLERVELPPLGGDIEYRICGKPIPENGGWGLERYFDTAYWMGRKHYSCHLSRRLRPGFNVEASRAEVGRQFRELLPKPTAAATDGDGVQEKTFPPG